MIFFPLINKFVSFDYLSSRNDDLEISVDRGTCLVDQSKEESKRKKESLCLQGAVSCHDLHTV